MEESGRSQLSVSLPVDESQLPEEQMRRRRTDSMHQEVALCPNHLKGLKDFSTRPVVRVRKEEDYLASQPQTESLLEETVNSPRTDGPSPEVC